MEELVMSFLELEELYDILIEEEKKIKEGVYSPFVVALLEEKICQIRESLDNIYMTSATFEVEKKDKDAVNTLMKLIKGQEQPQEQQKEPVVEIPVQVPPAMVATLQGVQQMPAPQVQTVDPFNPQGLNVVTR